MRPESQAGDPGLAFDAVPEIYDRIRHSYPEPLFGQMFSHFTGSVHVLECGPGTGQATASLLARDARVTAVEPGPSMAAFLRRKFTDEPRLEVVTAKFEDVKVIKPYDIVFAATSFHWVDAVARLRKAHDALRPGGAIAIVSTNQVRSDADRGYFAACQPIYRKYFPGEEAPAEVQGPDDVVPAEFGEIEGSELFGQPSLHRYRWDQTYTAAQYADLLRSYSGTNMMPADAREGLVSELCALADREFGGSVTRPLVITLTLAFRP